MTFSLSQKVALVTGSSRGLGFGVARVLGKSGARIVLNYLNDRETAEKAVQLLKPLKKTLYVGIGITLKRLY